MKKGFFYWFLLAAYIAVFCLVLFGCSPAKIGAKAVDDYKDSGKFPEDCALHFPVKTDSIYIEGETITDTLTVTNYEYGTDTIVKVIDAVQTKFVYNDRIVTKTVTVKKVDTLIKQVENTAAIKSLLAEIDWLEQDAAVREHKLKTAKNQRNYSFGLNAALLLMIAGAFYLKSKGKIFG